LRLLLLSYGHYSRFCCSLTAFAAPPKCQTDLTKELIPPLAASPTLYGLTPAYAALLQPLLLLLNAKLTLQKNQFLLLGLLLLSYGHYSRSAALFQPLLLLLNAKLTFTKEPISPLAIIPFTIFGT
jgi:hypothetical protein